MNLKLEIEFSKADILHDVDALKKQIDDMRPLPDDVEGRVMQKLRLDWNYNSNAIEGNRLSYGETVALIMEGITAGGKPLKDSLDIKGHNEAINFLLSIVKESRPVTESDIRALHKMILVESYQVKAQTKEGLSTTKRIAIGEYKTSPNHVKTSTGELHYYATPEETSARMQELMSWYSAATTDETIHPVIIAALFHHKFVEIHPFDDGNGRLSRILMNLIIMQNGYPPVVIKMDDRQNYYALLSRADVGESWLFVEYIAERLLNSLQLYLKAANGGNIDEDEDIDKEIALLEMQLNKAIISKERRSNRTVERVFSNEIAPLSEKIISKLKRFRAYFFDNNNFYHFSLETILGEMKSSIKIDNNSSTFYKREIFSKNLTPQHLEIIIKFIEYKELENNFSLTISTKVVFEEYNYIIKLDDRVLVSKLYHEDLQLKDEMTVIKEIVQNFKVQLQEKLKSSES